MVCLYFQFWKHFGDIYLWLRIKYVQDIFHVPSIELVSLESVLFRIYV